VRSVNANCSSDIFAVKTVDRISSWLLPTRQSDAELKLDIASANVSRLKWTWPTPIGDYVVPFIWLLCKTKWYA